MQTLSGMDELTALIEFFFRAFAWSQHLAPGIFVSYWAAARMGPIGAEDTRFTVPFWLTTATTITC